MKDFKTAMTRAMIVATICLFGCADRNPAHNSNYLAEMQACRDQHPPTPAVPHAQCINAVSQRYYQPTPGNRLIWSTRMSLAEQVDRHEITQAEAAARFYKVQFDVQQEESRTNSARAAAMPTVCTSVGATTICN